MMIADFTRKFLTCLVAVTFTCAANGVSAQSRPVVVELFTSQGCSSCPPADRMLGELADDPNVIALAYHVDYWDYLGWKDTFASKSNTMRQHSYLGHTNREWIKQRLHGKFTPEIVVQGTDSLVGHSKKTIFARIKAQSAIPDSASVDMKMDGNDLIVRLSSSGQIASDLRVLLVNYTPKEKVIIARGENSGKSLTYSHIVNSFSEVAKWTGSESLDLTLTGVRLPAVILVQAGNGGPIVASGRLRAN